MSCDVAVAAFLMFAHAGPGTPARLIPAVAVAPPSVASEPLFVGIVQRAGKLKAETKAYESAPLGGGVDQLKDFPAFESEVAELSSLDMQGHVELVSRGYTDDLKCILHGISQDLSVKLTAVQTAKTGKDEDLALRDMAYLLNDNVEVITAPPKPAA